MNTKTITLTLDGAKPNNLPDMVKDEVRKLTVACAPIAGSNTVSACSITDDSDNLTIGSATISGKNAVISLTASQTGCYTLKVSATLSSSEIFKGIVDLRVIEPTAAVTLYPTG